MYGFPSVDGKTIKVATEQSSEFSDPDHMNRRVSDREKTTAYESLLKGRLVGITSDCPRAETCIYTSTPDSGFVIDRVPEHPQIIVASPCSGHGFKHSAAIGEVVADLATDGSSKIDISEFGLQRFANGLVKK